MPDFKLVISDPATKIDKKVKVKVIAKDEVKSMPGEKESKVLPIAKLNSRIRELLGLDLFITLEVTKKEGEKVLKVKVHFKIEVDNSVPDNEVWISKGISEKFGNTEFEAIAYRTKSFQLTIDQSKLSNVIGMKIGDVFDATQIGIPYKLKITGGSDSSGFPMRADVTGASKRRVLLSDPPGFHPVEDGERRRKMIRGNTISPEIVQITTIIVR